jgi:glycosyltransferase involved in cell wall biosynthesis
VLERESSDGSGALASKILGIPLVAEINDDKYDILTLESAAKIICTHIGLIPQRYRHKTRVVSWAVNTDRFKPGLEPRIKEKLGIRTPIIGYVGSFYPWHGIETLVKAAPLILDKFDVHFVLVGDAKIGSKTSRAYLNDIKCLIKTKKLDDFFIFTGRVPYQSVPGYITSFDLCVAPYDPSKSPELKKYGFFYTPLKLFEYLAAGKPVVTTNVGNIRKIIGRDRGVLVPPNDHLKLANAVADLLRSPSIRDRLGKNARAYAEGRSWYEHCKQLEQLMEDTKCQSAKR